MNNKRKKFIYKTFEHLAVGTASVVTTILVLIGAAIATAVILGYLILLPNHIAELYIPKQSTLLLTEATHALSIIFWIIINGALLWSMNKAYIDVYNE